MSSQYTEQQALSSLRKFKLNCCNRKVKIQNSLLPDAMLLTTTKEYFLDQRNFKCANMMFTVTTKITNQTIEKFQKLCFRIAQFIDDPYYNNHVH